MPSLSVPYQLTYETPLIHSEDEFFFDHSLQFKVLRSERNDFAATRRFSPSSDRGIVDGRWSDDRSGAQRLEIQRQFHLRIGRDEQRRNNDDDDDARRNEWWRMIARLQSFSVRFFRLFPRETQINPADWAKRQKISQKPNFFPRRRSQKSHMLFFRWNQRPIVSSRSSHCFLFLLLLNR